VPFVSDVENNPSLSKLSPNFKKLEELSKSINAVKKKLKEAEARKVSLYF